MKLTRQQGTANYPIPIPLWDSDGAPLGSGVTPAITIEKNGGAAGAVAGSVTATNAGGTAYLAGNATDRNTLGGYVLNVSAAGAESYKLTGEIVAYDPVGDAQRGTGGTALPGWTAGTTGGLPTLSDLGGGNLGILAHAFTASAGVASAITAAVWSAGTRTLTGFGTLAADTASAVWAAGTRTLTSFGTLAGDTSTAVWSNASRTLSSFGTLVSDIAAAVRAALATQTITVTAPVDVTTGRLTLYQGDDHQSGDRLPTWTIGDWTGPDLDGATATLRLLPIKAYQRKGDRTKAVLEVDAAIDVDGTTVTVTAPVTAAQTLELFATDEEDETTHQYQIVATTADDETITVKLAPATVLHRIAPAE